jgi:hypothetical protein
MKVDSDWVNLAKMVCGLLRRNAPDGESGQITVFEKNGRTNSVALTTAPFSQLRIVLQNVYFNATCNWRIVVP